MVLLRATSKCVLAFLLFCILVKNIECGRGGGGGRSSSGGSRGSYGGSRGSSWGSSSWGSRSSSSSSSRTSNAYGISSGRVTKPSSNTQSTSHILPISTGSRRETIQRSHSSVQHATPSHSPSAPPMSNQHNTGNYAPSAPPLPINNNKPAPAPGWNVGNDANIRRDQTQGLNNAHYPNQPGTAIHPPPYSSVSNQPGTGMPPPPYPGATNHYSNAAPPPYPGGVNNYPGPPLSGVPPPPYPGTNNQFRHYPSGASPYSNGAPGMGGHYPTQYGAHTNPSYYQNTQFHPQPNSLPPPPPGYSPYGMPYYQKPKSGIKASHVMMGLALWQMTRPQHHHYMPISGYNSFNNPDYGYHEFNRQRYTTTYGSPNPNSNVRGAHNTLEMTHYVVPDENGTYKTIVGNMTCLSVYDAKAVSRWANRTMEDFYKKFPDSEFPLFETGRNTTNKFENFTMLPGRVIHQEPISVTCCGTNKGPLELSMLTNGKSPDVNCLHFMAKIPFKKITFVKVHHVPTANVTMDNWQPIQLVEPNLNSTTSTPLAPFPTSVNTTNSSNLTTSSADLTQTSTPTPLAPFPTTVNITDSSSSTTPSVDLTQTFAPLGLNNNSLNIENSTFPSLGTLSNNTFPSLENTNNI